MVIDATGDLDVAASAGAPHISDSYITTTVFRLGGVDTEAAARYEREEPEAYAELDRQIKRVLGGSWGIWWMKTPLPGVVWCNCPHMAGIDGLKVEDLTRAEIVGRQHIHALVDFVRGKLPGFEHCFVVDVAPQTGVPNPPAGRRVCDDQGRRGAARALRRQHRARPRLLLPVPRPAAQADRQPAGGRPALFGDLAGAEDIPRDPRAWRWAKPPARPPRWR